MKTILYGASDDLIEIDGAIEGEFDAHNKDKFEASDGTVGTIEYAPGHDAVWHIEIKKEGSLFNRVVRGNDDDDDTIRHGDPDIESVCKSVPIYSDVVIFNEGITSIRVVGLKKKK